MMTNSRGTPDQTPRSMRLSISGCTTAALSVAPSINASGCFSPLPVDPDVESRKIARHQLLQALSRQRHKL
jgi:hypothetical protein